MTRDRRENALNLLGGALIALAALAAYSRTFSAPFVLDAEPIVTRYPSIRHLWPLWDALRPPHDGSTVEGRPMLNLSLALSYAASGTRPWAYHAMNLAIHVCAGLALFGIVRRTVAMSGDPFRARALALGTALLWTLHPLQVESVTYIIQRAESQMGLCYLLTLYCFIRGAETEAGESGKRKSEIGNAASESSAESFPPSAFRFPLCQVWFALSFAVCAMGMATKEVMVSAPIIVFLYDRTFLAGSFREAWRRRRWPHLALASTWIVLGWLVIGTGNRNGTAGFGAHLPWSQYEVTQVYALVRYLRLALWPQRLVFDYGSAVISGLPVILPSAIVLLALAAGTGFALWRRRPSGFLGAWFFAILAPTSIVPVATQTIAEHRMYLPLAAVMVAAVFGIERLGVAGRGGPAARQAADLWATLAACAVLAGVFGGATFRRNAIFGNEMDLWADSVAAWPSNARAHTQLGKTLSFAGRIPAAEAQFRLSLELQPAGNEDARYDLGNCLLQEGRLPEAIANLEEAIRLDPGIAGPHNGLGNALAGSGRLYEAVQQYRAALQIDPGDVLSLNNLGLALGRLGRTGEALACYQEALRIRPGFAEAECNLGVALAAMGRIAEAVEHLEASLRLDPRNAMAHFNLGNALARTGRMPEAIEHLEASLRLKPEFAPAQDNLGNALFQEGRLAEAIARYEEAVRLEPDYARAHYNLGNALYRTGRTAEAADQFAAALRLQPDMAEARAMLIHLQSAESP